MESPKDLPKKIYPTAEDLSRINTAVNCPQEGCSNVFTSESNLTLHLAKTHKMDHLLKTDNVIKEYYCPENSCSYNVSKFFKSLKLLKQHFLKVHSEKSFSCDTCDMKFSTQTSKISHADYCGVKFTCCECPASYSSYESLSTHGRRKKHKILEKLFYKNKGAVNTSIVKSNSSTKLLNTKPKRECFILPKGSASLQLINCFPGSRLSVEEGSQTDLCTEMPKKTKRTQFGNTVYYTHNSQETQTLGSKKPRLAAETQTIGDYVSKKLSLTDLSCSSDDSLSKKSIKTQTKPVTSTTKSCNTLLNVDDFEFNCDGNIQQNSSSTQTATIVPTELLYSISTATHNSAHTDTNELNFEFMHSSSQTSFKEEIGTLDTDNYFNCNSETQTDLMSVLNTDDCSNICTQTCNDILLSNMGFNDIHTQTVLDGTLKSVESQTMMSSDESNSLLTLLKPVTSTTKSCNTSFNIDDFEFHCEGNVEQNSSGTQTVTIIPTEVFYSISTTTHDSTHTDTTDLSFESIHSSSQTSFKEEMDTFDSENFFNCNSETQTDFMSVLNTDYCTNICTQTCDDILFSNLRFNSIHTQTVLDDMLKSVESQTMMFSRGSKSLSNILKPVTSTTKSCNTSFNVDDSEFNCKSSVQQNSSSTQTVTVVPTQLVSSISTATHNSTHTDTNDLNFEFMHSSSQTSFKDKMDAFDSENFFNCNSETQTDFMSALNTDYCSNICTQTCDDILLSNLGFNNIHTQTVLDNMLKSVESQTMMSSRGPKGLLTCRDMANMEIQTDDEFKQLLEEINA